MNKVFFLCAILTVANAAEQSPIVRKAALNLRLLRAAVSTQELPRFPELKLPQSSGELAAEAVRRAEWERPIACLVRWIRNDIVEISIGAHEGLDEFDQLDVYHGEQRLGRVQLAKVGHRIAIGVAIPGKPLGRLETGDNLRRADPLPY